MNKKKIAPCDYNVKEILRRVFAFLIKNSDILNKKRLIIIFLILSIIYFYLFKSTDLETIILNDNDLFYSSLNDLDTNYEYIIL